MKDHKYTARGDNGRDYIYFEFWSSHRANSKANIEDAEKAYYIRHGRHIEVDFTFLSLSDV